MAHAEPNRLTEVRAGFDKYVLTGDPADIASFTIPELEFAIVRDSAIIGQYDSLVPRYRAMERRLSELKGAEAAKRTAMEKWIDRFISFIFGIASALLVASMRSRVESEHTRTP